MTSDILWTTQKRKLSDLIPVSYNPRKLSKKQADDLKKSLVKFNLAELPVINFDNVILAGHQRCKILTDIEGKDFEIEVRVANRQLSKAEADEYLIRSNQNGGEFDFNLLEEHFEFDDLIEFGFNEDELNFTMEADFEEVGLPELPDGDKSEFCQQTFTLHERQAGVVTDAISVYKSSENYKTLDTLGNESTNGNAIYGIVSEWLARKI